MGTWIGQPHDLPPIFPERYKAARRRVYFRVVMQQPWRYSAKQNFTFILLR